MRSAPKATRMRWHAVLLAIAAVAAIPAAAAAPGYHIVHRYLLGGAGGWDYLTYDPAGKRLFISRETHVLVVNPFTGKPDGEIPHTPGVHGIALAPEFGKGFTSNGKDSTVTVFDLRSFRTLATVRIPSRGPDAIVYDPASKRVFTFDGESDAATAIDARTNRVVATISLGGRPEFAVADGRGTIYDNIESTSEIVAIDASTATIVHRWPLGTCRNPSGISMDRAHERLFTACRGEMGVVSARSGRVIATLPTGAGTDATRFDPTTNDAFAPNGRSATLTVVHESSPSSFSVVQNARTEFGARTMGLDPVTGDAFLVTAHLIVNHKATSYRHRYRVIPGTFVLLVMKR
jgi:YVTN family beta-propeller protein